LKLGFSHPGDDNNLASILSSAPLIKFYPFHKQNLMLTYSDSYATYDFKLY